MNTDLNAINVVAVVAIGRHIDLYVNMHHIASLSGISYSNSEIGLAAQENTNPTEVVFSNAKVWTL